VTAARRAARRAVAVVQARLGSTRLPGKVLCDLAGDSMLARVIARLRATTTIDDVVIATTTQDCDDAIVREAERCETPVIRGSEHDVLCRYLVAAAAASADIVVRVTADCPLLDPGVVDSVVTALTDDVDYASNTHVRSFPRGLDVEALHLDTLIRIGRLATSAAAREHVTAYVMERPERFAVRQVRADRDDSDLRWTVDTQDDLDTVRAIYARCELGRAIVPYREVVDAVRAAPALAARNAHVVQKSWHEAQRAETAAPPEAGHVA
jgi:spore coat polysaccharide biosynthesis protein SpsF